MEIKAQAVSTLGKQSTPAHVDHDDITFLGFTCEMEFEYAGGVFSQAKVGVRCDGLDTIPITQ